MMPSWIDPEWSWEWEFLLNLSTLLGLGVASGYFAHILFVRNKAGRRDRLVWGLIGFMNAILILSAIGLAAQTGFLPDKDWIRIPARVLAIVFAVNAIFAAKVAAPLVYLSDIRLLNERLLAKRHRIESLERECALLQAENDRYRERHGDLVSSAP